MIVGFVGLKNSGKDTLVKLLQQEKNIQVYNLKFARGIKQLLETYFDIPKAVYECPTLKEKKIDHLNMSARELMINLGTYFRKLDRNCWINYIDNYLRDLENYDLTENSKTLYIFTDVRFDNEINYIKNKNGIIIDVLRQDLYIKEKDLIKKWGDNLFTKTWIRFFLDKSLVDNSEWDYWMNKKRVDYILDNTDLEEGYKYLKHILKVE